VVVIGADEIKSSAELAGIYKDLAELIGIEGAYIIYKNLKGQQITFPQKLYSAEYVAREVKCKYDGTNLKALAAKYGYTERHLRKMMNKVNGE